MPDSPALSRVLSPAPAPRVALVDLVDPDFAEQVVARLVAEGMRVAVIGDPIPGAHLVLARFPGPVAADPAAAVAH
ncbi:MAG: hypothetical protein R6W83_00840, partial [Cryobacterium sp.]